MTSRHDAFRSLRVPNMLALLALAALLLHPASAADTPNPTIRVHLSRPNVRQTALVSCDRAFLIKDDRGVILSQGQANAVYSITWTSPTTVSLTSGIASTDPEASETGAQSPSVSTTASRITISCSAGILEIAGNPIAPIWSHYHGKLSIAPGLSQLTVTNSVDLETYLLGVLGPEIGANAPIEAMKAQAIAARTYTIRNLGKLTSENADVDDTTRTQSYTGADTEPPSVREAVEDTQGKVITYDGALIDAMYSTDCGGRTALGPVTEPYLQPVDDPDCAAKPSWTCAIPLTQVSQAVIAQDHRLTGTIESLEVDGIDRSGRITTLQFDGIDGDRVSMTGAQFRLALGVDVVRSTCFTVTVTPDHRCLLTGRGWGHGLGMCQRGAIAMAGGEHPATYWEILTHYYTGVQIVSLTTDLLHSLQTLPRIAGIFQK